MAYLPQFENDIFISYPRVANAVDGWVDDFCTILAASLAERLGRDVKIWRDVDDINGSDAWRDQIARAVGSAGVFIPLIVPGYFERDECLKELDQFLGEMKRARDGGRALMPVYKLPADEPGQVPHELKDLGHHEFFTGQDPYYRPLDHVEDKSAYWGRMARVATDLKIALKQLKGLQPPPVGKVFVACCSPALHNEREQLRAALRQHNIRVVPEREYLWNTDGVGQQVMNDLSGALLSVHLVAREGQKGYAPPARERLQLELAIRQHESGALPEPLVWLQGSAPTDPERAALLHEIGHDFANRGADLLEKSFQELETQVLATLAPVIAAAAVPPPARVAVLVEAADIDEIATLQRLLAPHRLETRLIGFGGNEPEDAGQLAALERKCSHVIVLWGAAPPSWVEQRLDSAELATLVRAGRVGVLLCGKPSIAKSGFAPAAVAAFNALKGPVDAALAAFLGAPGGSP